MFEELMCQRILVSDPQFPNERFLKPHAAVQIHTFFASSHTFKAQLRE